MAKKTWELVADESTKDEIRRTYRMRVKGGYLYRYELDAPVSEQTRQIVVSLVFVPQKFATKGRRPSR